MKHKKTITICSSASFYKEVLEIEKQLKELGFQVKVPITAKRMQKNRNFDVSIYKTWYKNPRDYNIKTKLMKGHFKKIVDADAILIVNLEKNGIQGYIGANVLIEMALAFHYKKPIYLYNAISNSHFLEEILAMQPIIITKKLTAIHL